MTNLEMAQKIANKIETSTQEEINAMIDIVCDINEIDTGWMHRAVSNLYMSSESFAFAKVENNNQEIDPR